MTAAVLALRFALELAALVAFAVWGATVSVVLAVLAPLLGAALWGRFAAPKSAQRLADPARLAFEAAFFGLAAAGLVAAGHAAFGIALGVVGLANALAVRRLPEPA